MKKEKNKFSINKDDFIEFLSSSSPEEVNRFIIEKGKPRKFIEPMVFFKNKNTLKQ